MLRAVRAWVSAAREQYGRPYDTISGHQLMFGAMKTEMLFVWYHCGVLIAPEYLHSYCNVSSRWDSLVRQ